MTPQEQNFRVVDPKLILVIKYNEVQQLGLSIDTVANLLSRGVMLDCNIYEVREKQTVFQTLLKNDD